MPGFVACSTVKERAVYLRNIDDGNRNVSPNMQSPYILAMKWLSGFQMSD
jgi:hypothetical protein